MCTPALKNAEHFVDSLIAGFKTIYFCVQSHFRRLSDSELFMSLNCLVVGMLGGGQIKVSNKSFRTLSFLGGFGRFFQDFRTFLDLKNFELKNGGFLKNSWRHFGVIWRHNRHGIATTICFTHHISLILIECIPFEVHGSVVPPSPFKKQAGSWTKLFPFLEFRRVQINLSPMTWGHYCCYQHEYYITLLIRKCFDQSVISVHVHVKIYENNYCCFAITAWTVSNFWVNFFRQNNVCVHCVRN